MENHSLYDIEKRSNASLEIMTIIFKHKRKVLTVFASVVLTVTVGALVIPPVYEASSTLLVKMGREYVNRPEVGESSPVVTMNQEGIINSEIQIMTNKDLYAKVINTMGIRTLYPALADKQSAKVSPLDMSVQRFEKAVTVEGVKKSNVIQVSFQHEDPQVAARALNLLVDYYKEKHLQVFSEPQSSFLEQQREAYSQKLRQAENNLEGFKQDNKVYSLEEQRTLLLRQRMELDTAAKNADSSMSELEKKTATLKDQLKNISTSEANYSASERERIIIEAKARLLSMQLNEQQLLKKYTENNRLVVNARKEIDMVKNFLSEQEVEVSQKSRIGTPIYQEMRKELMRAESDLNSQRTKAAFIKAQLRSVDRDVKSLDLSEQRLSSLNREKSLYEKSYQAYAGRAEDARMLDEMNRLKLANISVIQPAAVPVEPIGPKKLLLLISGIIAGLVFGVGSAFVAEQSNRNFSTAARVEKLLGVPVLIAIPYDKA